MTKKRKGSSNGQRSGRVTPAKCHLAPVEIRSLRVADYDSYLPSGSKANFGVVVFQDPSALGVSDLALQIVELTTSNKVTYRMSLSKTSSDPIFGAFVEGDLILELTGPNFKSLAVEFLSLFIEGSASVIKQWRVLRHVEGCLRDLSQFDNSTIPIFLALIRSNNPPLEALSTALLLCQ